MSCCGRESASNAPIAWQSLLAADDGRVHRLLGRYPDHFRSLYSMAGTIEDRRFPDGVYFGQTDIARSSYNIFVKSTGEFLAEFGAEPAAGLAQRLATVLLSAAHGVISLPLGTPTMKMPDVRGNGRLVIGNLVHGLMMNLEADRKTKSCPKVTLVMFLSNDNAPLSTASHHRKTTRPHRHP